MKVTVGHSGNKDEMVLEVVENEQNRRQLQNKQKDQSIKGKAHKRSEAMQTNPQRLLITLDINSILR